MLQRTEFVLVVDLVSYIVNAKHIMLNSAYPTSLG